MNAQDDQKGNRVRIRFVDSHQNPIPYFASHFEYFGSNEDRKAFLGYVHQYPFGELLPYQDIGGGITPARNDVSPYFLEEINLEFEAGRTLVDLKRFENAGLPTSAKEYFVWYFPNSQVHILSFDEISQLKRNQINVIEVPGDLGSGKWKELGDFLFDASYFWRIDRGSRKELIKRCDTLIAAKKDERDWVWAGNLVFVREHWLHASARVGLFGHVRVQPPAGLDNELPWQGSARAFGRGGVALHSYPWEPYVAFKKVLEVNPKDVRAIFWTKLLPWVNGFTPPDGKNGATTDDYIRECRRVYGVMREQLDNYHRFWFLKEFIQTADGSTYAERYWSKKKGVQHGTDIQWAVDELKGLFVEFPFLQYQVVFLKEWLLYLSDPNQVKPLNLINKGLPGVK